MLAPLPPDYWSAEAAAHLALRAGFGQTPDESKKWSQQGLEAMLNHLLQTPSDNVAPPEWAYPTRDEDLLQRIRNPATTPEEKAQVQRDLNIRKSDRMADLINWWTLRMARSPAPLVEKMTLFWHGHFATSADKVSAYRMWLQNETIRRYALSNFDTLLQAISCDPAMLNWLDLGSSQKEHPNENFAREAGTSSSTSSRADASPSANCRITSWQVRLCRRSRGSPPRGGKAKSRDLPSHARGRSARKIRKDCRFKVASF